MAMVEEAWAAYESLPPHPVGAAAIEQDAFSAGWEAAQLAANQNVTAACSHLTSRVKFDGGNRSVVCHACHRIITRIEEAT